MVGLGLVLGCAYPAHRRASGWILVETERIQLRTNVSRRTAERLADEMQSLYDVLVRVAFSCAAKRDPIAVTVLPAYDVQQFAKDDTVAGFYRAGATTWLGDYAGQIVLPDDMRAQSKQLFLHEVTHQLSHECFPRMPSWLSEGFAGFFETLLIDSARVTIGRPPYLITSDPRVNGLHIDVLDGQRVVVMAPERLPSVESIVDLTGGWSEHDWRQTVPRYAIAWALVDLLELGAPDLTPRFQAYLGQLRADRVDPREGFKKAFEGVPLQDRLNAHLRSGRVPLRFASPPKSAADAAREIRIRDMAEEEAHLHLAWLGTGDRDETGRERVRLHLAAAKNNPRTRDAAYLVAALAHYIQDDLDGATREVDEGMRGAQDSAAFLEAQLDILLRGRPAIAELRQVADRLRPVARTGGQLCALAQVAILTGDRQAAVELGARANRLSPQLVRCRPEAIAEALSE